MLSMTWQKAAASMQAHRFHGYLAAMATRVSASCQTMMDEVGCGGGGDLAHTLTHACRNTRV